MSREVGGGSDPPPGQKISFCEAKIFEKAQHALLFEKLTKDTQKIELLWFEAPEKNFLPTLGRLRAAGDQKCETSDPGVSIRPSEYYLPEQKIRPHPVALGGTGFKINDKGFWG